MKLFIPITKIDEQKREVWGTAAVEEQDKVEEVFDYATSKPHFQKWSDEFSQRTSGQSLGNVRAMHGNVAAGKVIAINFDDANKTIPIGTKIVDDDAWQKCREGVYTGFSIGGKYKKRWQDGKVTRYTAIPTEISLVDNPCMPGATFGVLKSDGSTEQRAFKVAQRSDTNPDEGKAKYGDVAFADSKNKKYPIDTEAHIRAAWNYINKEKNAGKYSAEDLKTIKGKIEAAWKDKIDKAGPPSAAGKVAKQDVGVEGDAQDQSQDTRQLVAMAQLLMEVQYLIENLGYMAREGDAEPWADLLNDAHTAIMTAIGMCAQETDTATQDMALAAAATQLKKQTEEDEMKPEEIKKIVEDSTKDLVKAVDLAKITESFAKVEAGFKTITEDLTKAAAAKTALEARVKKIEETPQSGGPKLNAEDVNKFEESKDLLMVSLNKAIELTTDPFIKQQLQINRAALEIKAGMSR